MPEEKNEVKMNYNEIQIVGMRKNKDLKIVITIIILAIIGIIASVGIIVFNQVSADKALEALSLIHI